MIAIDDERWQERPLAIVVRDSESLTPEALQEFLAARVAKFWIPEYWAFTGEIARTSVGKIDKKALRAGREAGSFSIDYVK